MKKAVSKFGQNSKKKCAPSPSLNRGQEKTGLSQPPLQLSSSQREGAPERTFRQIIVLNLMLLIGATINKLKIYMCVLHFVKVEAGFLYHN